MPTTRSRPRAEVSYSRRTLRFTLTQLLVTTALALGMVGGATFVAFFTWSEGSILARSAERRLAVAARVEARTEAELHVAEAAVEDLERATRLGVLRAEDPEAVEAQLFSQLLDHPTLDDVTLTHVGSQGFLWQTTVFRAQGDAKSALWTRRIRREGATRVSELRRRPPDGGLLSAPYEREPRTPDDPTTHPTYEVTTAPGNYGRLLWSDLSHSELDAARPVDEQRVVLTLQKTAEDPPGHLAGVIRAGLLMRTIDTIPAAGAADVDPHGEERVFLCDDTGRLLTRLGPDDPVLPSGNDLRVAPLHVPPEIAAALAHPGSDEITAGGSRWLVTFREIRGSQDWRVGIVAPATYYTRDLEQLRTRFLVALGALTLLALAAGMLALRPVRRSLARVVEATARMRRFELAPTSTNVPLQEVMEVMEGVERAKTAMRTLGKYVPMDLVRELYTTNREPQLGGELVELSMMFTDIEGFTSLSERLAPDALAAALGAYLEAMTAGVRSTDGTVDKFIGDAVMAFWNAPRRLPDHPLRACRAVLACLKATRELYASPAWAGLPPLFTRYGVHMARVMVGNFGAPERLSYTALGDGVNLAARLEPLCKQYGVAILVSEAVVRAVDGGPLAFRLVDSVAVKGKHQGVRVYELLEGGRTETVVAYEKALAVYQARELARARDMFLELKDDPPSSVMAARCAAMLLDPPAADWDGVYVATSK